MIQEQIFIGTIINILSIRHKYIVMRVYVFCILYEFTRMIGCGGCFQLVAEVS